MKRDLAAAHAPSTVSQVGRLSLEHLIHAVELSQDSLSTLQLARFKAERLLVRTGKFGIAGVGMGSAMLAGALATSGLGPLGWLLGGSFAAGGLYGALRLGAHLERLVYERALRDACRPKLFGAVSGPGGSAMVPRIDRT